MPKSDARKSNAKPSPASAATAPAKPRRQLVCIEDRIPVMTDGDLKTLHANAERLVASGSDAQRNDALRLLPVIRAETEARAIKQAQALQARRDALREEKKSGSKRARSR